MRRLFRLVSWPSGRGVGEVACVWVVRVGSPAPGGVRAGKVEAAPRRRTGIPMVGRAALVWCALGRVMRCSVRVLPIFSGRVLVAMQRATTFRSSRVVGRHFGGDLSLQDDRRRLFGGNTGGARVGSGCVRARRFGVSLGCSGCFGEGLFRSEPKWPVCSSWRRSWVRSGTLGFVTPTG